MRLFRRRKRGRPVGPWYAQWFDLHGARHQRSTNTTDRIAAEAMGREWERWSADPNAALAGKATLNDVLLALLDHVESETKATPPKASVGTLRSMRSRASNLVSILGHHLSVATMTAAHVDVYIATRRSEGWTEHTIAKELSLLRAALTHAKPRGLWRGDVEAVVPPFDACYRPRERWASPDELDELLEALLGDRSARVAWMVAVAGEPCAANEALRTDIVRDDRGEIIKVLVRGQKTETRYRWVAVSAPWQRSLLEHALEHAEGVDGKLFAPWASGSYIRDLKTACRFVGCLRGCKRKHRAPCKTPDVCGPMAIEPLTPNDLRRTFAQWMRRSGIPLELIAPDMGHSTTEQLQRVYGRLDADGRRALVARLIPVCSPNAAGHMDSKVDDGDSGRSELQNSPGNQRAMRDSNPRPLASEASAHSALSDRNYKWKRPHARCGAALMQLRSRHRGVN
jgi:integrase